MNLHITKWYGRLGNNITQIRNCLHIAIYYKYNILLPKHNFFKREYIIINNDINKNSDKLIDDNFYYFKNKIKNIDDKIFITNTEEVIKILKDNFVLNNININLQLNKDDLLIHIRGGDVFNKKPHKSYIMPPLSYYKNIIDSNKFKNIYIISEDRKNPCIDILLKLYPNIIFKSQKLEEDIKLILNTFNIVESFGTFIPNLMFLSEKIINIYKPSYQFDYDYKYNCNVNYIDLNDYKNKIGEWKNNNEQLKIMLSY